MPLKTAILGVGLIGGSIGLALREEGWAVTGWGPREESLRLAMARGAINRVAASVPEAVEDAELVVLAGPIRSIPELMRAVAASARRGTVVTDVAGVKGQVLRWAEELLPEHLPFVGGHPMAGKEHQGVGAADGNLLRGCTYCLTPASEKGLPAVRQLVEAVGGRELLIEAADHDRAVAAASHLPFVAATAVVRAVAGELDDLAGAVAAGGFRDTTRVAMASPVMHADVCNFNADALERFIDALQAQLGELKRQLREPAVEQTFREAAEARERWSKTRAGRRAEDQRTPRLRVVAGGSHAGD